MLWCRPMGPARVREGKLEASEPEVENMQQFEIFRVRRLIWEEIQEHVKASEVFELRTAIGSDLIDQNEVSASPHEKGGVCLA